MSKADIPPVPPASQSPKGPGDQTKAAVDSAGMPDPRERNLDKQGRQGAVKVNTTNQGYQQDR